jgi:chromosome partitioning protein
VLIPLQPHFLALQGLGKLLQTIELVNRRINPALKVKGILLCMFDSRTSLSSEVRDDIEQFLDKARGTNCAWADAQVLPTFVRKNIKLAEAPSYGMTIFEYEQNCHGAEDYRKVAEYIHGSAGATQLPPRETPPIEIREIAPPDLQAPESETAPSTASQEQTEPPPTAMQGPA